MVAVSFSVFPLAGASLAPKELQRCSQAFPCEGRGPLVSHSSRFETVGRGGREGGREGREGGRGGREGGEGGEREGGRGKEGGREGKGRREGGREGGVRERGRKEEERMGERE